MPDKSNASAKPETIAIDGLLLLNKPAGLTSNKALQKVKRLLRARKAGHTGSLDPAATGMLPLCFGEATKVCAYLLNADKTYRVTAKLGEATDTGDADGRVIQRAEVPSLSTDEWRGVLQAFIGETTQIPPMYSALKIKGKRLYELARKGEVVERQPRSIRIDRISLLEASKNRLVLRVHCSKGTYIRTLVEDIAIAADTLAHVASLHRETVGSFRAEDMLDLDRAESWATSAPELLRQRLLPVDTALLDMPRVLISAEAVRLFKQGQAVTAVSGDRRPGQVRVYGEDEKFLGVGELAVDGILAPRRVFGI